MTTPDFADDIPLDLARRAHAGTSFVPEDRAAHVRAEYARTLQHDWAALDALATTDEKRAILTEAFARYRAGYQRHYTAYLSAQSRCMSTMIAGPANFPARRQAKRSATADKRRTELLAYRAAAVAAIRKALTPELAPVMAGDGDALERLQAKYAEATRKQAAMTDANAAIRANAKRGADAQTAALRELGLSPALAAEMLRPDDFGRIGYADYQIRNNGAEVRRLAARIETISAAQAKPALEIEGANARIEDSPAENRVRVFFPGKPDSTIRTRLKAAGFRWAPSIGAWQAYPNERSRAVARDVAGVQGEG